MSNRNSSNKSQRVLIISEHFLPIIGGTSVYTYNICKYLSNIGHKVYLVTIPSRDNISAKWYHMDGFNIFRLQIPEYFTKEVLMPRFFPIYLLKSLNYIISEIHPDIIHFTSGFYPMIVTRLCYQLKKIPLVWTIHNLPPAEASSHISIAENNKINTFIRQLYLIFTNNLTRFQLIFYKYDRIISVSSATYEKLLNHNISTDKISVIPNGVDTEYFSIVNEKLARGYANKIVVLTVAGIIEHKEQLKIVMSAPDIIEKVPNVLFLFVGPIRSQFYFNLLEKTIQKLGIEKSVEIKGEVSQDDLLHHYQRCDVYLQPSSEEGFCISILEALSCGKAVIGTPVGEIPKLIKESGAGAIIPNSSPEEISKAVIQLLTNKEMKNEFEKVARNYILNNFSWNFVAIETSNMYKEIIDSIKESRSN